MKVEMIVAIISSILAGPALGDPEKQKANLTAECATKGTDWDGSRNYWSDCLS